MASPFLLPARGSGLLFITTIYAVPESTAPTYEDDRRKASTADP